MSTVPSISSIPSISSTTTIPATLNTNDMAEDINNCTSYEPSAIELILPSPIIFKTLCVSTDKTSLFIVSIVRILFYVILYYTLNDIINLESYRYVKYVLLTLILVNIVYVGFVVSKNTMFSVGANISILGATGIGNRLYLQSS